MRFLPVLGAVTGAVVAVAATPLILGAVGFTSTGIAAGTIAAKMMSAAAVANGGGVAAGSTVAVLQSIGAAGLSTTANAALLTAGATAGGICARK
ncbi:interferon alpha-inducible protein 27-like protein 2A [Hemitrygon akajei]|uniref:interferon alpha-inducible protein 27-like protein 2A n=1 Tax=Hemitrygon akajei TaxID=2704970 RepID=UPI003BF9CBA0